MKSKRQALIREIVESQSIQTQEELAEALRVPWHGRHASDRITRYQGNAPAQGAGRGRKLSLCDDRQK